MVEIKAALVKELREATNVGMMECKRALVEAAGDKDKALQLLRERGLAIAGKKADRTAKDGAVASDVIGGGKTGVMIEVNCETDFVSRNETFQAFVRELVEKAKRVDDNKLADTVKDEVVAKITEIGENIVVRRNVRYTVQGDGVIAAYIHLGGKVGVLVEVGCKKAETVDQPLFRETAKDITLHIAAANPQYVSRDQVDSNLIKSERDIFAKQVEGKPAEIVNKIVDGKLEKFYGQICLLEQGFVKDPDQTVAQLLTARGKELGDTLTVRRYIRYQLGTE